MMTNEQRAAQFMPFKALTGYDEKINESAELYLSDEADKEKE